MEKIRSYPSSQTSEITLWEDKIVCKLQKGAIENTKEQKIDVGKTKERVRRKKDEIAELSQEKIKFSEVFLSDK